MSQKQTTHHPQPLFTPHHVYVQRIDNNLSLDPTGFLANDVAQAHAHCVRLGYNPMPGEPSAVFDQIEPRRKVNHKGHLQVIAEGRIVVRVIGPPEVAPKPAPQSVMTEIKQARRFRVDDDGPRVITHATRNRSQCRVVDTARRQRRPRHRQDCTRQRAQASA